MHLAGDGTLREPGDFRCPGEASVLNDQMKQVELVEIEGDRGQIVIHSAHQCMRLMNFMQLLARPTFRSNERQLMADRNRKAPENVPGSYYVDDTCIDCDLCRSTAPGIFRRHDDGGYTYVFRQPVTPEEIAVAEEAQKGCPTETIGNDG